MSEFVRPVFYAPLDRLLRLRKPSRRAWIERVRFALAQCPEIPSDRRERLLRAIALRDLWFRAIFRFQARLPSASLLLARLVPIVGAPEHIRDAPLDRPLIIALMHFGPIHFVCAVLVRLVADRSIYVFHAGGETGGDAARILEAMGAIPIVTGGDALGAVEAAIAADPRSVIVVAFDHLSGRGRRTVPFLGSRIAVATGLAYLARASGAAAVAAWGELSPLGLRVRVGETYAIDPHVKADECEGELMDRLFGVLETHVRRAPQNWTEWPNCFPTP